MKLPAELIDGGIGGVLPDARTSLADPELVLDLSRLVARVLHPAPTGVDRVEMAYARGLMSRVGARVQFGAIHPCGIYGRLRRGDVEAFIDHTEMRWEAAGAYESSVDRYRHALKWLWRLRPRPVPAKTAPRVLIQPSPNDLHRRSRIADKVRREEARFICLVHDLIPVSYPEYARPGGSERHKLRLQTIAQEAHGVVVNSQSTLNELLQCDDIALGETPVRVAPLGIDPLSVGSLPSEPERPYFMVLGTIEPRKNHLLLLCVWRDLCKRLGPERVPQLLIVGRRGWENENVIDMLERCTELRSVVRELGRIPDAELRPLVAGASALLMPSFAEGFGLPVGEALAAGTPVIASDLPAHREVGGAVPEYLDPLDGPAWREAVLAYASDTSRRRAQLKRIAKWSPSSWDSHIDTVLGLADRVSQC